jgi:dCMP deaminase
MNRISWNQYFIAQSHLLALRSTCTRLEVGATIVRDKRIIAGGYNGSTSGSDHCIEEGCYVIDGHCIRTIHAEMNAILQCAKFGVETAGSDIYVTHFPCLNCCKAIIQSGIKTVYYSEDYKNHPYAIELFGLSDVSIMKVELQEKFDPKSIAKRKLTEQMLYELENQGLGNEKMSNFINRMKVLYD